MTVTMLGAIGGVLAVAGHVAVAIISAIRKPYPPKNNAVPPQG